MHSPSYILVCLDRTKIRQLELSGLPPHIIPISPITKIFNISLAGSTKTISRAQLPITPAYAFTDYRAQGQTIVPVIVDISRPPTGGIMPFNIYMVLSRAKGQDYIWLLRVFDEQLLQQHPRKLFMYQRWQIKSLGQHHKGSMGVNTKFDNCYRGSKDESGGDTICCLFFTKIALKSTDGQWNVKRTNICISYCLFPFLHQMIFRPSISSYYQQFIEAQNSYCKSY